MIRTNELAIGDWVFDGDEVARVTSITCDGIIETTRRISNIEIVTPIPLTPEILEKNGFEKQSNYQWKYRNNSCKIAISIAPQIKIDGEIIGTPPIDIMLEGALFTINITSDCYVHTLQHCFRLAEIEKEITL